MGNRVRLPLRRDYLIASVTPTETPTMRQLLKDAAAIAAILGFALMLYNQSHPTSTPTTKPAPLYVRR